MGDSEVVNILRGELEDFCVDKNDVLKIFWEFCKEVVRKVLQKKVEEDDKVEMKKNEENQGGDIYDLFEVF